MQKNNANDVAKTFIKSMKKVFGNAVTEILLFNVTDVPEKQFSINFTLFEYFPMRFNYDKGHFGCCISFGERGVSVKSNFEWDDNINPEDYWQEISTEIKLRIPDKYLINKGWM